MDWDTSFITLSGVTEISLSTQRMLAILLKPLELVPAENMVQCVHLERPILTVKPPNSLITKRKDRSFFRKQANWRLYLHLLKGDLLLCSSYQSVFV